MNGRGQPTTGDADYHQAEAIRLASSGNIREAAQHFDLATRLQPRNAVWQFNAGLAWQQLNQLPNAIAAYRNALALNPEFFDAWSNLSAALKTAGEFEAAVDAGRKAVILKPRAAAAHLNLGNALKAQGDWTAAETTYRLARSLEPGNPRILLNLANTLRELGRIPEAIALLKETVSMHPRFAEAHRDLAFALLLAGDLHAGWAENEWRWETEELRPKRRSFMCPAWNGEDLSGRRIFVYTEQGFGDAIQFVRYVPLIAQRGGHVTLECQPELTRLFQGLGGVRQLLVRGDSTPQVDFHSPLLSLPRAFGTDLETVPANVPYLSVAADLATPLPITDRGRLKVGLVWSGNPSHLNDRARSMPLETLTDLLDVPGVDFLSLQIGDRARDIQRAGLTGKLVQLDFQPRDFADTAAMLAQLDLVVSVDTSVAHLAGALAKPVWLLLPFAPDWRWLLGREGSPWYPTMRLFRQPKRGGWTAVIRLVRERLEILAKGA